MTKIRVKNGSKVKFVDDKEGDVPGPVWKDADPINQHINHLGYKPDIGGCDSYDSDVTEDKSEPSSGCVVAYRCFSGPGRNFNKPVGVLVERGDGSYDDDTFYENAVKMAIYWDMEILVEHTKKDIILYFKDVGARKYLKNRPDIEEAGINKHRNEYGVKMPKEVKAIITKLLKLEVKENIHKCYFENVILDLLDYGFKNTDIAMALGIALLHRMDQFDEISEGIEDAPNKVQDFDPARGSYYVDLNGNLRVQGIDSFNQIQEFNPERDLSERDYEQYLQDYKKKMSAPVREIKQNPDIDDDILRMILEEQGRLN